MFALDQVLEIGEELVGIDEVGPFEEHAEQPLDTLLVQIGGHVVLEPLEPVVVARVKRLDQLGVVVGQHLIDLLVARLGNATMNQDSVEQERVVHY